MGWAGLPVHGERGAEHERVADLHLHLADAAPRWEARGLRQRGGGHERGSGHREGGQPERPDEGAGGDRRLRPALSRDAAEDKDGGCYFLATEGRASWWLVCTGEYACAKATMIE